MRGVAEAAGIAAPQTGRVKPPTPLGMALRKFGAGKVPTGVIWACNTLTRSQFESLYDKLERSELVRRADFERRARQDRMAMERDMREWSREVGDWWK